MFMLTENDRRILQVMSKNLLMTTGELSRSLKSIEPNGGPPSIQRLLEMGYIEKVESIGTTLVVTQKGLRAIRDD